MPLNLVRRLTYTCKTAWHNLMRMSSEFSLHHHPEQPAYIDEPLLSMLAIYRRNTTELRGLVCLGIPKSRRRRVFHGKHILDLALRRKNSNHIAMTPLTRHRVKGVGNLWRTSLFERALNPSNHRLILISIVDNHISLTLINQRLAYAMPRPATPMTGWIFDMRANMIAKAPTADAAPYTSNGIFSLVRV